MNDFSARCFASRKVLEELISFTFLTRLLFALNFYSQNIKKKFNKIKLETEMKSLESFSPLYKALKLFGILPFEINLKSGEVCVRWKSIMWMIFWVFAVVYLVILNTSKGAREPGEKSEIILSGWHWLLIFQLNASILIHLWSFLNRKNIEMFFVLLNEFDEFVSGKYKSTDDQN